jgi:acetyltransferase-like isoleucine patch superfamily enzyme
MRPLTRDSIPHLLSCLLDRFRRVRDTLVSRALAMWWKIDLGTGCMFYGLPMFRRIPDSSIRIGTCCRFLSSTQSNFAGINHPCIVATLREGASIRIGNDCGLSGVSIGAGVSVTIGDRVMAGANSSISDTDWHPVDPVARVAGEHGAMAPVCIEDDVWLGANVVVLKGVTIGRGTTVAANSVVSKSLPPGVVAAGVPAKPVKELPIGEAASTKVCG